MQSCVSSGEFWRHCIAITWELEPRLNFLDPAIPSNQMLWWQDHGVCILTRAPGILITFIFENLSRGIGKFQGNTCKGDTIPLWKSGNPFGAKYYSANIGLSRWEPSLGKTVCCYGIQEDSDARGWAGWITQGDSWTRLWDLMVVCSHLGDSSPHGVVGFRADCSGVRKALKVRKWGQPVRYFVQHRGLQRVAES